MHHRGAAIRRGVPQGAEHLRAVPRRRAAARGVATSVSPWRRLPFHRAALGFSTLGVLNMATATRGELRLLVEQLADEELDAARDALQRLAKRYDDQDIPEYHLRLQAAGVIDRIPDPNGPRRGRRFKPIRVEGKPVSETLIEDRG